MNFLKIGLTSLLFTGFMLVWALPAYSQSGEVSGAYAIEEILVTARRREESLRDVPGTVTALTAEVIEAAGIQRAKDFIALTPGVSMVNAAEVADTQVNIRGINGARDAENSFAYILDGVLYTNPGAFNREYTDLTQIEVFKGPQGAIYGRNAAAGAIIVSTSVPDNERKTKFTISTAEDSTNLAKFSTSGAITEDQLFYRISADWRESDGFYRNSFQNGAAIVDNYDGFNVNGRLVWQRDENTRLDTKLRVGEVDASSITFNSTFNLPVFAAALNNPPAFQDVNDFDFVFHPNIISDNDQESFEFSTKLDHDMGGKTLTTWALYSDIENDLMSDGTSAAFGFYNGDAVCQQTTADLNAAGQALLPPQFIGEIPVGVIFAPNGSFLGAYTPTTCDGIQEQVRSQKDFSLEFRLASDDASDLQWMIGAYFLDIDREVGISLNRDSGSTPVRGLYQAGGPNATASLTHDQFDSRVYAVFGQLEYDVNENVEVSLALRYDKEERDVRSLVPFDATQSVIDLNFDTVFNDPLNPALSSLINSTGTIPSKSESFSEFQPKLAITVDATDDVTLFGSWGVGFKAGGFNNSGSAATVNIFINSFINGAVFPFVPWADNLGVPLPVITDDYKEETSSAFEAGFNANLLDGRLQLNGAGYYTEVDDMQFFEFLVGTFGLLRVVSNIDKVEISGFEMGATYHVNDHVRFYAGGNWVDSIIKANSSRPDTVGNESPYTPNHTLNLSADFDFPINDNMTFFARVDGQVVGETWFHTVQEGQRPTIFMPLFEIGFAPFFGDGIGGLGTGDYAVSRRDEYSTVDLRFGVKGENWSIAAFGSNITDEKYLEEVIPAPEFGGSYNHPGSQKRYGIEFSYEF
jgi:iron complex outermembrane receptor protein